jgi:hypothetical protein
MATLAAEPSRRIFVSSIPNIHQLWEVLHTNTLARTVWASARICQSMLGATRTLTTVRRCGAGEGLQRALGRGLRLV